MNVTAIELVAEVQDRTGFAPKDLKISDFLVLEDGVEHRVIGVDYLALPRAKRAEAAPAVEAPEPEQVAEKPPEWHFLFYFESELSSAVGRNLVAGAIGREVDGLVARGTVDVVFASPSPVALVRHSRDPKAIRDALKKITAHKGVNQLQVGRQRFRQSIDGRREWIDWNDIRPFVYEDVDRVVRFRKRLTQWLSGYRRHAPRMAVIVTDGFDLDPIEFYITQVPKRELHSTLRAEASGLQLASSTAQLAKELAGGSWIVSSVPGQMDMGMTVDDAATWGIGRVRPQRPPPGLTPRPGESASQPSSLLMGSKTLVNQPIAPLTMLAEATGGTVIGNYSKIDDALDRLSRYVKLTYQVGRAPDAKIRKVEVRSNRPGLKVRAQHWVAGQTPPEIASARTMGLLDGATHSGELPVAATLTLGPPADRRRGTLRGSVKLDALSLLLEENSRRSFRITVASRQGSQVQVISRIAPDTDVSSRVFTYRIGLDFVEPPSALVVMVEDVLTGAWGSARVGAREMKTE